LSSNPAAWPSGQAERIARFIERERRIALATRPLCHALGQTEHYTDLRGVNHPLSAMRAAEASLVLALLERHTATLHRGEFAEHLLRLEETSWQPRAAVATYGQLIATAAEDWLCQTPLHRALTQRTGE
jgi:hypothetical protein